MLGNYSLPTPHFMAEPEQDSSISCEAFQALPLEEQAALLWTEGHLLGRRWGARQAVGLYQLGDFYCELSYDTRTHALLYARTFSGPKNRT
jgi:hypothetical protein